MTKKQSVFPLLLAVMLLVMLFVFPINKVNAEEDERPSLNNALLKNKPVGYTYHGDYGMGKEESKDDIPSEFIYSDELFLADSNILDPEIAKMSVALSILAYDQSKVCTVLRDDMEFTVYENRKISDTTSGEAYEIWSSYDTVVNNKGMTIDDNDYVAYTISSKMIDDYIVYCIPIKGTSSNYEWFSNFNLGEKNDVEHRGFRIAAERVYFDLLTHFAGDGYNSKPQKRIVYFTGHSRGAAVANLLSGWLSKGKSGRYAYQNHIFGYTFACPSVSTNADTSLSNIYNFNNPGDLVTLVPNESWTEGYKRYGKTINTISTKEFDNIGAQFERISEGKQFVSVRGSSDYTDFLSQLLPTKDSFYGDAAQLILNLTAFGMGKGTLEDFPAALAKSGLTVPKILIGIRSFYENPFLWASKQAVGMASDYKELIDFVESNDEAVSKMTEEEFSAFLRKNSSMINRIQNAADVKIVTASDFRMSLTELKLIHGGIIEIADAINKHSSLLYDENGNILDRITHGHSQITYTVWINALFYGCQGWMNYSGEAIHVLPELVVPGVSRCAPVKTVGGACFSNCSALKTLWLPDSEYIGSGVCYNDENLDVVRLGPQIPLIGENAFYNCTKLRDITMPGTAKVGYHAFANCSAIENVTLNGNGPMTDYAYNVSGSTWNYWDSAAPWKYGADKVIIGEGITSVSSRAFTQSHDGSENTIKRISLPNSLKVINEYAFYDCQAEMKLPTDLTQIKSGAFYNCKGITGDLVLSDELEIIQDNAFYGCSGLTGSLVIPETISGIPNNCFRGCSGLEALKLSNENVGIGEYAFYGCSGLSGKLVLKKGNVYRFAFKGCTSLSELVIPVGTSISTDQSFGDCKGLKKITMPADLIYHYNYYPISAYSAFDGCTSVEEIEYTKGNTGEFILGYNTSSTSGTYRVSNRIECIAAGSIKKITLEEGITEICGGAFDTGYDSYIPVLKEITIPSTVEKVGSKAFYGQKNLKIEKPLTNLQTIDSYSFYDCTGLTTEMLGGLPGNLENIPESAFWGCAGLAGKLELKEGMTVGRFAFKGCTSLSELVIPVGTSISTDQSFGDCKGLKKITMPADLIYHYNYYPISAYSAFDGCTSVEEIEYTKGNTGEFILGYNTSSTSGTYRVSNRIECIAAGSIKKITLEEGITEICGGAFDAGYDSYIPVLKEITIPSTVEKVGSKAFYGQKNLKIEKPLTNLQTIDSYSFYDCTGLTTEMLGGLPGNLENIPESAFWGCAGLAGKLELKEGMTVGRYAFKGCTSLSELVIPVGTSIATDQSFGDCTGLKKITIPADLIYRYGTTNGNYSAFMGCSNIQEVIYTRGKTGAFLAGGNTTTQYQIEKTAAGSIEKVTLEEGITEICGGAFDTGYDSHIPVLKEITIPSTVEKVESKAFYGQKNLKIEKPLTNLRDIGSYAFFNCQELRAIDLLGEVETIGSNAFDGCTNLSHINIYSSKAPAVGSNAVLATTEVHALFNATGYDVGGWPQYHPILDLLRPIDAVGHNLNLSGSIGVNYYFHLSDEVLADEGAKIIFNLPNGLYSEKLIKDAKVQTVKGIECREFGCKLHSSQMTGNIEAIVVMSDGTESNAFPYTVKTYADVIIENKDNNASFTKVTPLIKAMLNYGGYAQSYFKYDDNPLANEDLTEEERNAIQAVTAEDVKDFERVVTGSQEGLKYEGSNLMLTSETCIRHFFTVQSGHAISEYTFKLDGKKLTPVKSGKMYYVEIPNIASGNLDKTYTVTAGGITIQYSAMSYVYTQLGKTDLDPDLANTLKALYLYNQEANTYYGR